MYVLLVMLHCLFTEMVLVLIDMVKMNGKLDIYTFSH